MTRLKPFRLAPYFSKRIWGKKSLKPWFESTGTTELVGEAWLTGPSSVVETGEFTGKSLSDAMWTLGERAAGTEYEAATSFEFPLLVKILFPNEKLSVQVHPDDAHAQAMGQPRGKTECWYVLEAEPGATVMLGLKPGVGANEVRAAVADATLEQLLEHVPVSVGDMIFVDAGTVHAIAPGVVLLEVQQTSDTTFRLYDYGRPRELHLEQGLAVMKTQTEAGKVAPKVMDGFTRLIEEQYFAVDRFDLNGQTCVLAAEGAWCLVGLKGLAVVEDIVLTAGQAIVVPAGAGSVQIKAKGEFSFVRCLAPAGS